MLWEALGGALGGFGDARRPPPNKKTTIYKNVGSTQTPDKPALLAQCYSNIFIYSYSIIVIYECSDIVI